MDTTTCCCTGYFTCNEQRQLFSKKEDHFEIWGLDEASREPALVYKQRIQGDVATLVPFTYSSWVPNKHDGVVVISKGTDLQLLCWDDQKQGLTELCHIPNALPSRERQKDRRTATSQAIVLDSALCCVVGVESGQFTVAVVKKNEKFPIHFSGTFHEVHSPVGDHTGSPLGDLEETLSLSFLTDREGRPEVDLHGRPLLAQLYKETGLGASSVTLVVSALDCKTGELHRCWQLSGLDSSTRVMLTSSEFADASADKGGRIVLLSGSGGSVYHRSGYICSRIRMRTEGAPTAAAQMNEGFLVVGDSAGGLNLVDLSKPDSAARPLCFGPEAECFLASGVQALYRLANNTSSSALVCKTDDGEIYVIQVPDDVSSCSVRRVASTELPGLAPVHDFAVVHVSPQESELVLAHGVGRHGCLTRVQEAAALTVANGVDLEDKGFGIPTFFPVSLADRPAVVLSYDTSSRVLHQSDNSTWRPLVAPGFDESLRTLAVGVVGEGRFFVQVTSDSVRLIESSPPYGLRQERPGLASADGKPTRGVNLLHLADVRGSEIVVAGKDELLTFRFEAGTGQLEEVSCQKCESQISAVGLSIRSEGDMERRASNAQASSSAAFANAPENKSFQSGGEPKGTGRNRPDRNGTGGNGTGRHRTEQNGMRSRQRAGLTEPGLNGVEAQENCAYVVVGYWTTHVVEVLRWADLEIVTRVQLGGSDLPRSVKLVEVDRVNKLLVGTAEGSVLCYGGKTGRVEEIRTGSAWRVKVGSAPVSLSVIVPEHAQGEIAGAFGGLARARGSGKKEPEEAGLGTEGGKGERKEETRPDEKADSEANAQSAMVYAQSERAVLLNLTGPSASCNGPDAARVVGGDGWLHVACCGADTWLVVGDNGQVRTASLDTRVHTRRRSIRLGVTPRMVACHVSSNSLLAACVSDQGAHSLRVFHARTMQQLADVSLDYGHVPTCLLSAALPVRPVDDRSFDSYTGEVNGSQRTGEFVVLASTMVTEERTVSVLSVFDVEKRPLEDDRVEVRLFLLGSYAAGTVICSVAAVSVPSDENSSMGADNFGGLSTESGREASRDAGSTTMLVIGTHEGLQVLSVAVDRAGGAAVAALEAQAMRAALAGDKSVESPRNDATDALTPLEQDFEAVRCRGEKSASNGDEVGLLVVKVDAEAKLPAAVTKVSASSNVLFVCTADGALLVFATVRTSAGSQLLLRARTSWKSALVFPLSTSRVLVDVRGWRKTLLVERNPAEETEHSEKLKRAAVRIGEARGLDLLEPAGSTEDQPRIEDLKDLPQLRVRQRVEYRRQQDPVGFCRLSRGLQGTGDEIGQPGLLGTKEGFVAVVANGFTVPVPMSRL